jgi:group I intron endonuclease
MSPEMTYNVPLNWTSGIYKITAPTGEFYYGSAQIFKKRYNDHYNQLKRNIHNNKHMQNLFNKTPAGWRFEAIEQTEEKGKEIIQEQNYLNKYCYTPGCLNLSTDATAPMKGRQHSDLTKKKISLALKGRKLSAEHYKKCGLFGKGKTYEELYGPEKAAILRDQRRKARLGKPMSSEQKIKISNAKKGRPSGMFGKKHSLQTIAKIKLAWAKKQVQI